MPTTTKEILQELRLLKKAIAQLAGTADLPENTQLDSTALEKAAKQFTRLQTQRAQWVSGSDIDLEQFQQLCDSEKFFECEYKKLKEQVRTGKTKRNFVVPEWLRDISSTPVKLPEREVVQADIDALQEEFSAGKYGEYVDVHKGTHAMLKYIYPYEKYLEPGLRRKLSHWCDRFNTASKVLNEITGKKHKFIPAPPEDLIEL